MRKLMLILVSALFALTFVACENEKFTTEPKNDPTPSTGLKAVIKLKSVTPVYTASKAGNDSTYTNMMTTFDGSLSSGAVKYDWDMGDHVWITSNASPLYCHKFTTIGNYVVRLRVTGNSGNSMIDSLTVKVKAPAVVTTETILNTIGNPIIVNGQETLTLSVPEDSIPHPAAGTFVPFFQWNCVDSGYVYHRTTDVQRVLVNGKYFLRVTKVFKVGAVYQMNFGLNYPSYWLSTQSSKYYYLDGINACLKVQITEAGLALPGAPQPQGLLPYEKCNGDTLINNDPATVVTGFAKDPLTKNITIFMNTKRTTNGSTISLAYNKVGVVGDWYAQTNAVTPVTGYADWVKFTFPETDIPTTHLLKWVFYGPYPTQADMTKSRFWSTIDLCLETLIVPAKGGKGGYDVFAPNNKTGGWKYISHIQ